MPTSQRGFASMPKEKPQAIAGMGRKAALATGRGYWWTKEEASRYARKGALGRSMKKRQAKPISP